MMLYVLGRRGRESKLLLRGDSHGRLSVWQIPDVNDNKAKLVRQDSFENLPGVLCCLRLTLCLSFCLLVCPCFLICQIFYIDYSHLPFLVVFVSVLDILYNSKSFGFTAFVAHFHYCKRRKSFLL